MSKISASPSQSPAVDPDLLHRSLATAVVAFQEAIARKTGMSISEHRCLGTLSLLGPSTAGRLARETGFTTGAITGIVDRLEKAGLVRREPNPEDRRSVIIRPLHVPERNRSASPLYQSLGQAMARLRREFTKDELEAIYRYLRRTTEILKDEARRLDG